MNAEQLADLLQGMVEQNCWYGEGLVDSGCISTHAEAIQVLIDLGRAEQVGGSYGRQIQARIIPLSERRGTIEAQISELTGVARADGEAFDRYALRAVMVGMRGGGE